MLRFPVPSARSIRGRLGTRSSSGDAGWPRTVVGGNRRTPSPPLSGAEAGLRGFRISKTGPIKGHLQQFNRPHSRRLGVSRLDRTGEARLVRGAVSKGGGDCLHHLLDAAAGSLLGGRAVAHLRQVGAIAGDKADALTDRAVA